MKARAKALLTAALAHDAMAPVMRGFFARHVPIVFYHGVWPAGSDQLTLFGGITRQQFRDHIERLARRFSFVSLQDALSLNASARPGRKPVICVTFDDGL